MVEKLSKADAIWFVFFIAYFGGNLWCPWWCPCLQSNPFWPNQAQLPTFVLDLESSSMCCYLASVERLLDLWGVWKHFPEGVFCKPIRTRFVFIMTCQLFCVFFRFVNSLLSTMSRVSRAWRSVFWPRNGYWRKLLVAGWVMRKYEGPKSLYDEVSDLGSNAVALC